MKSKSSLALLTCEFPLLRPIVCDCCVTNDIWRRRPQEVSDFRLSTETQIQHRRLYCHRRVVVCQSDKPVYHLACLCRFVIVDAFAKCHATYGVAN